MFAPVKNLDATLNTQKYVCFIEIRQCDLRRTTTYGDYNVMWRRSRIEIIVTTDVGRSNLFFSSFQNTRFLRTKTDNRCGKKKYPY